MNQPMLLHIIEKLEALLGKLPEKIQKPILHELTPLKELFLQQRPPRLLLLGSIEKPVPELVKIFFDLPQDEQTVNVPSPIFRWREINVGGHGKLSILDARGALDSSRKQIEEELRLQPADVIFFLDEASKKRRARKAEIENLIACLKWSNAAGAGTKIVGMSFSSGKTKGAGKDHAEELASALAKALPDNDRLLETVAFDPAETSSRSAQQLMSILGRAVPNQARIEMIRISRDREEQREVAHVLVKSTSAICAAIGAQPIPLADLPILTTLQLMMVSGIMYVSGRERSLRAATEFVGAIGANVGVGMLLREGVRAVLKFVPGWGNVVCGMVAGAGTYAIGRAATVFFLEGVSIKDARRTYLVSRKKRARPALPLSRSTETGQKGRK
jgi:uncharacterized protein (DUF697 family)